MNGFYNDLEAEDLEADYWLLTTELSMESPSFYYLTCCNCFLVQTLNFIVK